MALLDAELVADLVECSQVSFLVHHRRPASKGGKRVLLTSNPTRPCRSTESSGHLWLQNRPDWIQFPHHKHNPAGSVRWTGVTELLLWSFPWSQAPVRNKLSHLGVLGAPLSWVERGFKWALKSRHILPRIYPRAQLRVLERSKQAKLLTWPQCVVALN